MTDIRYPFPWPSSTEQPVELAGAHRCPAHRVELPSGDNAFIVTGYHEVRALLTDPRISKNRNRPDIARMVPPTGAPTKHFGNQVEMDPPGHPRMRRLIAKAFTAARVQKLRPHVAAVVDELIADMVAVGPPADLSTAFAHPLSIRVICELLGVPEEDRAAFMALREPPFAYMRDLIARKREDPGDDLITDLIRVSDADDGRLSEGELNWWSTVLLLAGYETSANQILSSVVLLLHHPEQLTALRANPTLTVRAVEELLRYQVVGTSLSMLRYVTDDIDLGRGVTLPKGSSVIPSLECANFDPAAYDDPLRFDISRSGPPQLTFSHGRHFCPGAPLARIELQIGLRKLLEAFPRLALAVPEAELKRRDDPYTQGFIELPVTW